MKKALKSIMIWGVMMMTSLMSQAQKADEQRMEQDIEVAENVLGTMMRQQTGKRNFFPMNVSGNYTAGYGVTFRIPRGGPFMMYMDKAAVSKSVGYMSSYSYSSSSDEAEGARKAKEAVGQSSKDNQKERTEIKGRTVVRTPKGTRVNRDSLEASTDEMILTVAKNFLADYGDIISQLKPEEKVTITNRGDDFEGNFYVAWAGQESRRSMISVEAKRDDINQLKQGKITRDQFMSKLKIVNSESAEELDPDLEVLSSMFSRVYREDLSKTYYVQGNVSYERLKDFGVIYYMKVYSSNQNEDRFSLPTVGMRDASQEERDKKVKELYPKFESELKSNLVEYGRMLQSLKDEEQVMFKVRLTKCEACGIPESIELSIKNSALKDYSSGKASKDATVAKISLKKVGEQ